MIKINDKRIIKTGAIKPLFVAYFLLKIHSNQIEKDDPQPHVVVALGLLTTKREPSSPSV